MRPTRGRTKPVTLYLLIVVIGEVLQRWAYSARLPLLPVLSTGLAPLLQWLIVPGLALAVAFRFRPRG